MIEELPIIPERIVAEISRQWHGNDNQGKPLLCQQFERVILNNAARGFELESWQFQSPTFVGGWQETIIAVFVKRT